jgi:hypothetical protein
MDRFFLDAYGPDAAAEREGVEWLAREARRLDLAGAVIVPSVDAIRNLGRAIGFDAAEYAKKNRYFTLDGVRLEVFSGRTQPGVFAGPLLVPWANDAMVASTEECRPPAICAIPWAEDDLAEWKRAHDPIDVRTGEPLGEAPVELTPLVTQALRSLTTIVNQSTGIHHPSDAQHARQLLKALYIVGEPLDESEIRTWAIAHGWEPRHADNLGELAAKIAAGKRVKGAAMNKTEAKQVIERLQAAIEQPSQ